MVSYRALYYQRSGQVLRKSIEDILMMRGAAEPARGPKTLFTFNTPEAIQEFATGSDADIGGLSTVNFDLDPRKEVNASIGKLATGVFWGDMRVDVKPGMENKIRGGFAGFRNKRRPTMFGDLMDDVSQHEYLALRVRLAGDPKTHNSYYVNIQTGGPVSSDVWQHRLYFKRKDNDWEDVFIPFTNFVRTNSGEMSKNQLGLFKERIRSVGISILGGNSGAVGSYELGIDSIRAVNEDEVLAAGQGTEKGTESVDKPDENDKFSF